MKQCGPCITCKCEIYLPDELYNAAKRGRGSVAFYCGFGHAQVFAEGETDLEIMTRERNRLRQRLAERDDAILHQRNLREATERKLLATRGVITRIKKRVGHGVCPCCNRTFGDLSRHMKTNHPTYAAEAAE
jgi:uncharacterized protein with PIN domain